MSTKDIRTKIKSIKSTQKITSAMEMVAASKMRKAQERMQSSKPYAKIIRNVIEHLSHAKPEYRHKFLEAREVKRVGYIVISTDRGLCGGLNINLFRRMLKDIAEWKEKSVPVDMAIIGTKGQAFFARHDVEISAATGHVGEQPSVADLIGAVKVMFDKYLNGEIDRLYLVFNEFINTMKQQANIQQLLPVQPMNDDKKRNFSWDYIYEPDAVQLLEFLLTRYVESQVYQGMVDNLACEQAARMVAMKSATDNAGDIIDELQLMYNKARQASITQELSEIVAGAQAV